VTRAWRTLAWCAVAAFAAYRLPELTRYALWYDELFSVTLAQSTWGELIGGAIHDRTNPPLFYALLKLWIGAGGISVGWMRLLPCLMGIALAVPVTALARRALSGAPGSPPPAADDHATLVGAGVALACAASSPLVVFLSNELRGYSLLLLLAATSLLAFWRVAESAEWSAPGAFPPEVPSPAGWAAVEHRRRVVLLATTNVLLVYAHYFGWLIVLAEVGAAAIWSRRAVRPTIIVAAAAAVAFAPWALAVARDAATAPAPLANVDWISRPALAAIPGFYDALVARVLTPGTAIMGAVVVLGALAALVTRLARRPAPGDRPRAAALAWFATLPVVVVFAASVALDRSLFVPRYLLVAAPAWWLLLGSVFAAGRPSGLPRTAVAAGFCAFVLAAGALRMTRGGEKVAWDRLTAAIAADAARQQAPDSPVVVLEGFTALPLGWYGLLVAGTGPRIRVTPFASLGAGPLPQPAWLVVRGAPGGVRPPMPGPVGGVAFDTVRVAADSTADQLIVAYRLVAR
jgi:hypothetical protein